jgi:hypothetical protein
LQDPAGSGIIAATEPFVIEIKEAVQISIDTLKKMPLLQGETPVELEEVELEDDANGAYWVVTFSYPDPHAGVEMAGVGPNLAAVLRNERSYKSVRLLASDGTVRGIKTVHV